MFQIHHGNVTIPVTDLDIALRYVEAVGFKCGLDTALNHESREETSAQLDAFNDQMDDAFSNKTVGRLAELFLMIEQLKG